MRVSVSRMEPIRFKIKTQSPRSDQLIRRLIGKSFVAALVERKKKRERVNVNPRQRGGREAEGGGLVT